MKYENQLLILGILFPFWKKLKFYKNSTCAILEQVALSLYEIK
ncbi:hypothetical protein [Deferribacter desulfuricans]|nr:hypothetical protein [Deferribacter desulfuricans]